MGKLIKNYGDISLWLLEKEDIPNLTLFVLDNYYIQYSGQHVEVDVLNKAISEDMEHFEKGYFFALKDGFDHFLGTIKAVKIMNNDKFPLEEDFQITYSDFYKIVFPINGDIWLFGRLVVDREYFKKHPKLMTYRNIIFRILICKAIECMSYHQNNILIADLDVDVCRKLNVVKISMIPIGSSKLIYASEAIPVYNRMQKLNMFYNNNKYLIT